jgi:acyl carrier protein
MTATLDRLIAVIGRAFPENEGALTAATPLTDVFGYDSLGRVHLALAVERAFGIQLAPSDLVGLRTIGAYAAMLDALL